MDWLWIIFALSAALIQAMRFMVQKQMAQAGLTATGATWARFLYSLPMIWLALWAMVSLRGMELPVLHSLFWPWALLGGASQILATVFTVMLFARRNFAVGVTLRKSEVLLTAAVGWALLGETPGWGGFAAMVVGMVAILMLSGTGGKLRLDAPSASLGLGAGLFFAFSGVGYRAATLQVASDDILLRPALALGCVVILQNLMMLAWLLARDRGEITRVFAAWRPGLAVGITSFGGSFCWFAAFALQSAAVVFAVGQVEVLFSLFIGARVFSERLARRELAGIALLIASVIALVAATA
ncbi:DMT family transporter [Oceanicola sp. 502str15]|uniref:DMT family transporter n=1 Tax=Oceanicola sp. 502str15 TaxID=2696061 RepID=UPI0020963D57|nr:DMT family transporter [Oceanicola sp. 502str15]MCO6382814.1 EamA family transporter [Oceanicola sp. 502str15]